MQEEALLELPLSDYKQKVLRNEDCRQFPLQGEIYGHERDSTERGLQTNLTEKTLIFHYFSHILTFPWLPPQHLNWFSSVCPFSTNVLLFIY